MFVTLEGVDRSGKTTQAELLARELGSDALLVRDPGGTAGAERIRELLADPQLELDPMTELLLFGAARAELVAAAIRPALETGRDVVCDRFADSTVAYQGVARGVGIERAERLNDLATGGLSPDLTVLLRIDPERAVERGALGDDRFEREGVEFQRTVAAAFDRLAEREPERIRVVDADGGVDEVHARVMDVVRERARV